MAEVIDSVLTTQEKSSLVVDDFIFHIIIAEADEPSYLDAITLDQGQKDFFKERILDACEGTQYIFNDKENSNFVRNCENLINGDSQEFLFESRKITNEFCKQHKGSMSDGVFIVSKIHVLRGSVATPLVALLKIDHSRVLRYKQVESENKRQAVVEEIKNSFVEHKKAIQKWAIIDISDSYKWDVLARERGSNETVADYFENFLGVILRETASRLTVKAVRAVHAWAKKIAPEDIQEGEEINDFRNRATNYMGVASSFNTDFFIDSIIKHQDKEKSNTLKKSLREHLEASGVAGQVFEPKPNAIKPKDKKSKLITAEGVEIEWTGEAKSKGLEIKDDPSNNGEKIIIIRTHKIEHP